MIIEYAQELAAIEQEKDRECRNYVLSGWLADKLATLIKNELIEELEDLEI
jgi:hypothetical protein